MKLTFLITDPLRGGSPLLPTSLAPDLAARGIDADVVSIAPPAEISDLLLSRGILTSSFHAPFLCAQSAWLTLNHVPVLHF
jgi:hypothetical protein